MPVFILMINVEPDDNNPQIGKIAGAYVNCFLEADTFELAEDAALKFLKDEHWLPITLDAHWEVTEKDYENNTKGLEAYKQIIVDKENYTFHTYLKSDK